MTTADAAALSLAIEQLLVARNPRGMAGVRRALEPGYCLRAARLMDDCVAQRGEVLIATGFPVGDTFETDGPVGAISLYRALDQLGARPTLVCGDPLAAQLSAEYRVLALDHVDTLEEREAQTQATLEQLQPALILAIERPGQAADGDYYNMRGETIGANVVCFDTFFRQTRCPTIAIGDGGNELGMGKVADALRGLDIVPAETACDELIVADVSNWGGHALVALLGWLRGVDLLADFDNQKILRYLSEHGSVDGVTRRDELTEDGLPGEEGAALVVQLRRLTGFLPPATAAPQA